MMFFRYLIAVPTTIILTGCQMVDWHCTKGGQWSPYYTIGDNRCTYFCADTEEKFCGKTPAEAEAKMAQNPAIKIQRELQAEAVLVRDKVLCGKLGFKPETEGMANCLLTQQQNHLNDTTKSKDLDLEDAKRASGRPKLSCTQNGPFTDCY